MKRIITALLMAAALAAPMLAIPSLASAQVSVGVSVDFGPPPLPYYPQPFCPGVGFIWAPGYWSYSPYGYYWVPGTWVLAPAVGLLWTPGWWGWRGGLYWWNAGYWGARVGYYGGINYGYGYGGVGYMGGYWRGGAFYYNRAVSNVNVTYIHNTYNQTVINNTNVSRVSYNGGAGGTRLRPTQEQEAFAREQHIPATQAQMRQERVAMNNPAQRFAVNNGRPAIAATTRPGKFGGAGVVRMNRAQNSYTYHPAPRDQAAFRNESRSEPGRQMQAGYPEGRPPEERAPHHTEPPYSKPPPRHKEKEKGRPPR